jgi:putative serine protease PepD
VGDVISSVGDTKVGDPDDVAAAIQDRHPSDVVKITVRRGGSTQTLDVTLGERPSAATP